MGKNRDRISIVAAILEVATSGVNKTHIMFGANLSFSLLEKYLDVAVNSGFIRFENSRYYLTERGGEFLKEYRLFERRYVDAQKMLETLSFERERFGQLCVGAKIKVYARSRVNAKYPVTSLDV